MSTDYFSGKVTLTWDDNLPYNTAAVSMGIIPEIMYCKSIRFEFGQNSIDARVIPSKSKNLILLSYDIFRKLGLFHSMEICANFDNNKFKFGPLVGVFMNENAVRRLKKNNPTEKMEWMARAAKDSNVLLYFFTTDDIIWSENSVNSVIYNKDKNIFEERKMPLPDVLYDRGGGFTIQGLEKAREMRKSLNSITGLLKINSQHYFDKWDLHKKLSRHNETKDYLPDTRIFTDASDLEKMIEKYDTVYLKNCTGSNGRGIIRVRKQDDSLYEYSYFKEKVIKGVTQSLGRLVEEANELMNDKSFIIQEGIDVLTYQGNKVDLRILVQRSGIGKWQITSMPVRIAVNDCAVTSTKSGSKVYRFDEALMDIIGFSSRETDELKANIRRMMITVVKVLEDEYGTFGELGIDIAIDKNKKLWFIESNAKPAKDTILIAGPESDIYDSFRLPFEYAKYLTRF